MTLLTKKTTFSEFVNLLNLIFDADITYMMGNLRTNSCM